MNNPTETPITHEATVDGGVVLTQSDSRIELSSNQLQQAMRLHQQASTGKWQADTREYSLRVKTSGARHHDDVIVQFGADGIVHFAQISARSLNTIVDTVSGMNEWCGITS